MILSAAQQIIFTSINYMKTKKIKELQQQKNV